LKSNFAGGFADLQAGLGMLEKQTLSLTDIRVPAKRAKTLDPAKVQSLGEDILQNGMTIPIQVRRDGTGFILVEGLHRLEAMRALGETYIEAYLVRARLH
jgi:ParB-like chromosome segregation protein Spo0J